MDIGLSLLMRGRDATRKNAVDLARFAEDYGYHSVWASDHFVIPEVKRTQFPGGADFPPHWREGYLEALTTLTYLAGHTETIRLGTSALVLPLRNPVQLARQIATLDLLNEGRTMLAVTAGYAEDEFDVMGVPFTGRGARLEEYIAILKTMWTTTPASFAGNTVTFDALDCGPLPVQKRALPILVGGSSPASIRRAARLGDGWHPAVHTFDGLRHDIERFRAELSTANRPATDVQITAKLSFFGFEPTGGGLADGSPCSWIRTLSSMAELGARMIVIDYIDETAGTVHDTLRRFEREVRPYIEDPQGSDPSAADS